MKKKILFLTVKFDTGGTEKVTYDIITRLNPDKYDITLMSMYAGGYYWDHLPEYVHKKYFFPKFIRYVIRYVTVFPGEMVYRTFIHEKYDVEIACGDDIPSRVINHSPNRKSKKIAWIHMDVQERGYQGYEIRTEQGRKKFYRNFDKIVNVSYDCEKKFCEKFGKDLPTCVIYNPVPVDEIRKKAAEKPAYKLEKDKFHIVCSGRFTPQKGFDRLLDALYMIKNNNIKDFQVTILGDGYERTALEEKSRDYGLQDYVIMPGFIENPYAVMKQADLFLLSSRDESFSLVVAEAMVLGIPVLSTRCTGPVELLKNGEAGCLVENSTESICENLEKILTDELFYQELQRKAHNNKENFNIEEQIEMVEALLDTERR